MATSQALLKGKEAYVRREIEEILGTEETPIAQSNLTVVGTMNGSLRFKQFQRDEGSQRRRIIRAKNINRIQARRMQSHPEHEAVGSDQSLDHLSRADPPQTARVVVPDGQSREDMRFQSGVSRKSLDQSSPIPHTAQTKS